jgi:hypothetical protein
MLNEIYGCNKRVVAFFQLNFYSEILVFSKAFPSEAVRQHMEFVGILLSIDVPL